MEKLKKVLTDRNGWSYILTCVLILLTVALVSVVIQYAYIYHIAGEQKAETQLKLDSYVTSCAVKNYNALKQGEFYGEYINHNELREGAYTLLWFQSTDSTEHSPEGSNSKYTMSRPNILACVIYSLFASSPPSVNVGASAVTQVWTYVGELLLNMLILVGTVKLSDRVVKDMMGL